MFIHVYELPPVMEDMAKLKIDLRCHDIIPKKILGNILTPCLAMSEIGEIRDAMFVGFMHFIAANEELRKYCFDDVVMSSFHSFDREGFKRSNDIHSGIIAILI